MRALGMLNFDEDVPANSTWYLFRKRMLEYYEVTGDDLMKRCFQRMTAEQIVMHGISGSKVRMDSKLINSNIANMNRLELILEVVRSFVKPLEIASIRDQIGEEGFELLTALQTKSVSNITYPLSATQQKELLVTLGVLIQQILVLCHGKNPEQYRLLKRLWNEQYTAAQSTGDDTDSGESNSGVQPRDPQDLSSSSVQSAHDSEATFRKKGNGKTEKKVKGYHGNITETCSVLNPFNLIVDVDVREANVGECDFLLPSLRASEEVFEQAYTAECTPQMQSQHIEHVTTEGGYDSLENRIAFTQEDAPH